MEQNPTSDDDQPAFSEGAEDDSAVTLEGPGVVKGFWGQHQWVPYVLPLAVFLLLGMLEPKAEFDTSPREPLVEAIEGVPAAEAEPVAEKSGGFDVPWGMEWYPLIYSLRLAATIGCILLVLPVYRQFPCKVSVLAFIVGVVGAAVWIGICRLNLEERLLTPLGLESFLGLGERAAYDPFSELKGQMAILVGFLAVRFLGLVLVVPLIEEFFLRGFLMRFVIAPDWWKVRIGTRHALSLAVGTLYGVLTHPAEMFAAAIWFSLITWLMLKTRNLWDCVTAHAITNLLLGVYVVTTGDWVLW